MDTLQCDQKCTLLREEINKLIKTLTPSSDGGSTTKKSKRGGFPTETKLTPKTDILVSAMTALLNKKTPGYAQQTCTSASRQLGDTAKAAKLYIKLKKKKLALQNELKQEKLALQNELKQEKLSKQYKENLRQLSLINQKIHAPIHVPTKLTDLCYDVLIPILQEANSLFSNFKLVCKTINECVEPHRLTKLVYEMLNKGLSIHVKYDKPGSITGIAYEDEVELKLSKEFYDFETRNFLSRDPKTEVCMQVTRTTDQHVFFDPVVKAEFSELPTGAPAQVPLEAFVINNHNDDLLYTSTITYSHGDICKFLFTFIKQHHKKFGFNVHVEPLLFILDEDDDDIIEYATELRDLYNMLFNAAIEQLDFTQYTTEDKYDLPMLSGQTSVESMWTKHEQGGGKHTTEKTKAASITHKGITRKIHMIGRCKRVMYKKEMMSIAEFKKALGPVRPKQNK